MCKCYEPGGPKYCSNHQEMQDAHSNDHGGLESMIKTSSTSYKTNNNSY